jgi:hypothetical protein
MTDCANCAGTGTTIIAVIALILVIILIILVLVFFFFPSSSTLLDIRGTNFNVVTGNANGSSGKITDTLSTDSNNLYISQPLLGNITLSISSSSANFVGKTIGVKNTTVSTTPSTGPSITLIGADTNMTIDPAGLTNVVLPGHTAWLVCTKSSNPQTYMVLIN